MKKIRVTRGGCGIVYYDENGTARHALKKAESGPFECDDKQADRLVRMGVASYVEDADQADSSEDAVLETENFLAGSLPDMTVEQLKRVAADFEIDVTACKRKADYVKAIHSALKAETEREDGNGDGDEDEDVPPTYDAEVPV